MELATRHQLVFREMSLSRDPGRALERHFDDGTYYALSVWQPVTLKVTVAHRTFYGAIYGATTFTLVQNPDGESWRHGLLLTGSPQELLEQLFDDMHQNVVYPGRPGLYQQWMAASLPEAEPPAERPRRPRPRSEPSPLPRYRGRTLRELDV